MAPQVVAWELGKRLRPGDPIRSRALCFHASRRLGTEHGALFVPATKQRIGSGLQPSRAYSLLQDRQQGL